jgi:oligosaccharide repeat unit polymerase
MFIQGSKEVPKSKLKRDPPDQVINTHGLPKGTKVDAIQNVGPGLLSSPAITFCAAWVSSAALTALPITDVFSDHSQRAGLIALGLIASHLVGVLFATRLLGSAPYHARTYSELRNFETRLGAIWVLISVIEIVYSSGIPMLWLKTSPERTYEDFGIHSLHGAANGIWLYLATATWIRILERRSRTGDWQKALILGIWPILLLSRALLTIFLASVVSYAAIASTKSYLAKFAFALAFAALFIAGFGVLGDVRGSEFSISAALGLEDTNWPPGILWVYAYTVSPITNLALNVFSVTPSYSLLPSNTLSPLLPSQIRQLMGIEVGFNGYLGDLVHGAFNVSTAFSAPFHDWGWFGMMLLSALLGAIGHRIWSFARVSGEVSLLAVFNALLALSIFTNQFNQLPVVLFLILVATHPFGISTVRVKLWRRGRRGPI